VPGSPVEIMTAIQIKGDAVKQNSIAIKEKGPIPHTYSS
jgi:hypothetical protein